MGGGPSGAVSFPQYLEEIHRDLSNYDTAPPSWTSNEGPSLLDLMETALGTNGNPFENQAYTDPATLHSAVNTEWSEFDTSVDALDHKADWQGAFDKAVTILDTDCNITEVVYRNIFAEATRAVLAGSLDISAAAEKMASSKFTANVIAAYGEAVEREYNLKVRDFSSQMSAIGGVYGTGYTFGLALLSSDHVRGVNQFSVNLANETHRLALSISQALVQEYSSSGLRAHVVNKTQRDQMVMTSTEAMIRLFDLNLRMEISSTELLAEINRIKDVSTREYEGDTIDLEYREALWGFEVFQQGGSFLGALGGSGAGGLRQPSRASSTLGGALKGAGTGAALGNVVPGLGTAAGAGIGALVGGLAGYLA